MQRQERWERLEEYLFDHEKEGSDFSAVEYANSKGFDTEEASADLQAYLREQRRSSESNTLYVLRRVPGTRTNAARWAVGVRTKDQLLIGKAFYDDVRRKAKRAFEPDLRRIGQINPRAAKRAEDIIDSVLAGAMVVLEKAITGVGGEDELPT
jgi:hypothetical protein